MPLTKSTTVADSVQEGDWSTQREGVCLGGWVEQHESHNSTVLIDQPKVVVSPLWASLDKH